MKYQYIYDDDSSVGWYVMDPYIPSTTVPYTTRVWTTCPPKPDCFKAKNPCRDCAYKNDCESAKE